jgi:hypothetical protein
MVNSCAETQKDSDIIKNDDMNSIIFIFSVFQSFFMKKTPLQAFFLQSALQAQKTLLSQTLTDLQLYLMEIFP